MSHAPAPTYAAPDLPNPPGGSDIPSTSDTVSVASAARRLGVHPNTVRTWSDQGRLPYLRINARGDRRYRREDLEHFLTEAGRDAERRVVAAHTRQLRRGLTPLRLDLGDRRQDLEDRRARELRALGEISRITARAQELEATLLEVAGLLRERFGYRMISFAQLEADVVTARLGAGLPDGILPLMPMPSGLIGAALTARAPLLVRDVRRDARYAPDLPGAVSEIVVPIKVADRSWGAIVVADDRPGSLDETDLELLVAVADQLGSATAMLQQLQHVERRARQAETLQRISADVSAKLELDHILERLVDRAMELFDADRAAVFERKTDGRFGAILVHNLPDSYLSVVQHVPMTSLGATVIEERRSAFATDYPNDPRAASFRHLLVEVGFDTAAMAPLVSSDGQVTGLLALYHDTRRVWSMEDLATLDAVAGAASAALTNARLYQQTATWAEHLQSIQQIGVRLGRFNSVQQIAQTIASELRPLIDHDHVRVYRVDGDMVVPVAWKSSVEVPIYGQEAADDLQVRVGQGITGWVAQEGVGVNVPDAGANPHAMTIPGTPDDEPESMLLAPMRFEDEVIGVIVLVKQGLGHFTDDQLRLLEIYAAFAAQAMANAAANERLTAQSAALERQVRSQRELLAITESVLTTLDPRVVLTEIADRLGALVHVDNLAIDLHDETTQTLRPLVSRGTHAGLYMARSSPVTSGLGGWVIRNDEAVLVPNTLLDPRVLHHPEVADMPSSMLCVPLRGRDRVLGVLTLERLGEGASFSDEEFDLVKLYAAQAAIGLSNAQAHQAVEVRAQTDTLTGLKNRGTFQRRLDQLVARNQRFGLLMLDLDGFKAYNDRHGHPAGDILLRQVAQALEGAARDADFVFRYGGDEFTVLVAQADEERATMVAERVRVAIAAVGRQYGQLEGPGITCSIGVAVHPLHGGDSDALLRAADHACYRAKREGRDRVELASAEDLRAETAA